MKWLFYFILNVTVSTYENNISYTGSTLTDIYKISDYEILNPDFFNYDE